MATSKYGSRAGCEALYRLNDAVNIRVPIRWPRHLHGTGGGPTEPATRFGILGRVYYADVLRQVCAVHARRWFRPGLWSTACLRRMEDLDLLCAG